MTWYRMLQNIIQDVGTHHLTWYMALGIFPQMSFLRLKHIIWHDIWCWAHPLCVIMMTSYDVVWDAPKCRIAWTHYEERFSHAMGRWPCELSFTCLNVICMVRRLLACSFVGLFACWGVGWGDYGLIRSASAQSAGPGFCICRFVGLWFLFVRGFATT